jgi:hypothetical protein
MTRKRCSEESPEQAPYSGDYLAAVRFRNGEKDLFRVRHALDVDEARRMVLDELNGVLAIVITRCRDSCHPPGPQ